MKSIRVSAAVIQQEDRIFITERGYGDWKGYWEFPGGKREEGETGEETIQREIWEELETKIQVEAYLTTVEHDYPTFHLTMDVYLCSILSGTLKLKEHEAALWITKDQLDTIHWCPADIKVKDQLKLSDKVFH